jgi:hypothetical protein
MTRDTFKAKCVPESSIDEAERQTKEVERLNSLLAEAEREIERLREPFSEANGRAIRGFMQPSKDVPAVTITYDQWESACAFIREGDSLVTRLQEANADLQSRLDAVVALSDDLLHALSCLQMAPTYGLAFPNDEITGLKDRFRAALGCECRGDEEEGK